MGRIIEVSNETLMGLSSASYTLRTDLERPMIEQIADLDTREWITIPHEFTGGRYSAYLSPARLAYSPAVEEAGERLSLTLSNTGTDSLDRKFIGDIDWQQTMNLLDALGVSGVSAEMTNDFLKLLDEGVKEKISVYTRSGMKLRPDYLTRIQDDIVGVMSPRRAEWSDSYFERKEDGFYVLTNNKRRAEKLDPDTLTADRILRISFKSWLDNPTTQGLPKPNIERGDYHFWHPMDGAVSWFSASSKGASFGCDEYLSHMNLNLGVRMAIKFE